MKPDTVKSSKSKSLIVISHSPTWHLRVDTLNSDRLMGNVCNRTVLHLLAATSFYASIVKYILKRDYCTQTNLHLTDKREVQRKIHMWFIQQTKKMHEEDLKSALCRKKLFYQN